MSGRLASDPLFVGLTRPSMIFGVSTQYAVVNMMLSVVVFIQAPGAKIIIIALVMHLIGYLLCFKEPRFMELYLNKNSKCPPCANKSFYGANSYFI